MKQEKKYIFIYEYAVSYDESSWDLIFINDTSIVFQSELVFHLLWFMDIKLQVAMLHMLTAHIVRVLYN
ncbi:unnamed protein product [Rotaria magnacalcarata]